MSEEKKTGRQQAGMERKGGLVHDALVLFVITLIAALALGFVNEITKEPIAQAQAQAKVDACKAVFPSMSETAEWDNETGEGLKAAQAVVDANSVYTGTTVDEILLAKGSTGETLGWIMTLTSSKGYGGKITMTMGVSGDGRLQGIEFLEISETPGLGMKAKDEEFKSQFQDVRVGQYSLAKRNIPGDTEIQAISSATITTAAVTRMLDAGLKVFNEMYKGGVTIE